MSDVRAIFITGGGSGIGRATAQVFAAHGWRVGLADVNAVGLAETRALLPAGMAETYHMDVRDRAAWAAALDGFVGVTGRLDVLHNNAGVGTGGSLTDTSFDDLDRLVAVNLISVINGAKIGFRHLAATPGSCLLNTASASAIYGSPGLATYSATKFAVRALTEALDGEWHAAGVRVRSLIPGFIDTPLLSGTVGNRTIRERVTERGMEITPVGEVAEAAWRAVHGDALHTYVGRTAHRLRFAARWLPGSLRKRMRR